MFVTPRVRLRAALLPPLSIGGLPSLPRGLGVGEITLRRSSASPRRVSHARRAEDLPQHLLLQPPVHRRAAPAKDVVPRHSAVRRRARESVPWASTPAVQLVDVIQRGDRRAVCRAGRGCSPFHRTRYGRLCRRSLPLWGMSILVWRSCVDHRMAHAAVVRRTEGGRPLAQRSRQAAAASQHPLWHDVPVELHFDFRDLFVVVLLALEDLSSVRLCRFRLLWLVDVTEGDVQHAEVLRHEFEQERVVTLYRFVELILPADERLADGTFRKAENGAVSADLIVEGLQLHHRWRSYRLAVVTLLVRRGRVGNGRGGDCDRVAARKLVRRSINAVLRQTRLHDRGFRPPPRLFATLARALLEICRHSFAVVMILEKGRASRSLRVRMLNWWPCFALSLCRH